MKRRDRSRRETILLALWAFRFLLLLPCLALSRGDTGADPEDAIGIFADLPSLLFLLYFAVGTLARLAFRGKGFDLRALAVMDYFAVLLRGYFAPADLYFEFLFVPFQLVETALVFPPTLACVLIAVLGVPGSVFLSRICYDSVPVAFGDAVYRLSWISLFYYGPVTLGVVAFVMQRMRYVEARRRADRLEALRSQVDAIYREISQKMFRLRHESTLEERRRISKEVHDTAGYVFMNLIMMLQAASAVLRKDVPRAEALIREARDYAEKGINEIRYILREIRGYNPTPPSLQNELFEVAESFRKVTGVRLSVEYGNWPRTFSTWLDTFLISFLQEGLTNALKHGSATSIRVLCWDTSSEILIRIGDNGRGAVIPIRKGIGITAIEETVQSIGGRVDVRSDEHGFEISVAIPAGAIHETSTL